jgi:hypothetical protein
LLCDQVTFRTFYSPILGGILRYVWLNSVYHTHFTTVKHSVSPTIFSWFFYHATCRIEYSLIKIRSPRLLPISYRLFNSRRVEAPVPVFGIQYTGVRIRVMVFNATFNNISAISWRSVLLVGEMSTQKNHRPVASHWQILSHNVVSSTHRLNEIRIQNVKKNELALRQRCKDVSFKMPVRWQWKNELL